MIETQFNIIKLFFQIVTQEIKYDLIQVSMDYAQVIPIDITKLNRYSVPRQLFICTCIVLFLFLILSIILLILWFYRTFKGYTNTDYIADYAVKMQAQMTMKKIALQNQTTPEDKLFMEQCRKFSRYQSRLLQFSCLIVIVAINIGTYTCTTLECVAFFVAFICFMLFNVFRISENRILRTLWIVPLIVCYFPFYIFEKSLLIL